MSLTVPIVDFSGSDASGFDPDAARRAQRADKVRAALSQSGFMYVVGHGIDAALLERAFAASRLFFGRRAADKQQFAYTDIDANFGYQGIEVERLDPMNPPDLKETFTMRNAVALPAQAPQWPDDEFRLAATALYEAARQAALRILGVVEDILELSPGFFAQRHRGENLTLRFLHYPAGVNVRTAAQLGAGAHTDYGSITLLFQDDIGGLELRATDGTWHAAPPVPGAVVINTGDLMQRWTNDRFRSTVHRVRPMTGSRDRYSIALFVDPDTDVEVECIASCATRDQPARYPKITAGDHIRQKIAATHEALK